MTKPAPTIIPGTRYGHLLTTGVYIPGNYVGNKKIIAAVECTCDCGCITYKKLSHLKSGVTQSCSKKCPFFGNITHGLSLDENGKMSKEYAAWHNMKERCDNPNNKRFKDYGGRGISVYPEWQYSPEAFIEYIGKAPSPQHSIDRINNDGNYEPGNVRWATSSEQCLNRRSSKKYNNSNTEQGNKLIKFG